MFAVGIKAIGKEMGMRAVVTKVKSASVAIEGQETQAIESGLLVLLGSQEGDTEADIAYIVDKVCNLRIFEDEQGKMNRSLREVGGEILVVSQFTLLGDARKGRRPSFIHAGAPAQAEAIYDRAVEAFIQTGIPIKTGTFQTHMQVASVNDGPVTILLDSRKLF